MNAQKYNKLFYSDRQSQILSIPGIVTRENIDLNFYDFPTVLRETLVNDCWVESIIVNVINAFNTGAISVSDTAVIVDPSRVDLTIVQPYEIPIWKQYPAGTVFTINLTGAPTSGIGKVIFKLSAT